MLRYARVVTGLHRLIECGPTTNVVPVSEVKECLERNLDELGRTLAHEVARDPFYTPYFEENNLSDPQTIFDFIDLIFDFNRAYNPEFADAIAPSELPENVINVWIPNDDYMLRKLKIFATERN